MPNYDCASLVIPKYFSFIITMYGKYSFWGNFFFRKFLILKLISLVKNLLEINHRALLGWGFQLFVPCVLCKFFIIIIIKKN